MTSSPGSPPTRVVVATVTVVILVAAVINVLGSSAGLNSNLIAALCIAATVAIVLVGRSSGRGRN